MSSVSISNIKSKFAFFRRNNFVYLDSAATTQIPDVVIQGMHEALEFRGNPGRGSHAPARRSAEMLQKCKESIASFLHIKPIELVITNNTTDAINLVVDAYTHNIQKDDVILISRAEHHSNMLPYLRLRQLGARIKYIETASDGCIDIEHLKRQLTDKVKMVALQHCSNVYGTINDIVTIGSIIKSYNQNIVYVVDGAQAVAHIPVDLPKTQADFYAFSAHKMYGPDGIGCLYVHTRMYSFLRPVRVGGGTVENIASTQDAYEDIISPEYTADLQMLMGGTANLTGLVGMSKAVGFLLSVGFEHIRAHEETLLKTLLDGLQKLPGVTIFGSTDIDKKIGVVAFRVDDAAPKEIGDYMNTHRICIRYGAHCAFPLAEHIGSETVRVSVGVYNSQEDVATFLQALQLFLDQKKGYITNPLVEEMKKIPYSQQVWSAHSPKALIEQLSEQIKKYPHGPVVVMGGHFLGIPDRETNSFFPSIKSLLPERLWGLLDEFGMTEFPLFTWRLACQTVSQLKMSGADAKILIVANDTTGINELRLSDSNTQAKAAIDYRQELLARFAGEKGIPDCYADILFAHGLTLDDIVRVNDEYYMTETLTRNDFKEFVSKNKVLFSQAIEYVGTSEKIDISIKVLDNQEIKTCTFNTFHSKTGGKFCIVEVCRVLSELFGAGESVRFKHMPKKIANPLVGYGKGATMIMYTPAMCNNAVNSGAELYIKLMLQGKSAYPFQFINVPFGPTPTKEMRVGGSGDTVEVFVGRQDIFFMKS